MIAPRAPASPRGADLKRAVATAEAAGLIVVRVDVPPVMLTAKGREAVQPGRPVGLEGRFRLRGTLLRLSGIRLLASRADIEP